MTLHALSTIDNPYNPFTQPSEWYEFDENSGYHSSSLLARISSVSDEQSQADQDAALEQAIDEIVSENVSGMHIKVPVPEGFDLNETFKGGSIDVGGEGSQI